MNLGQLFLEQEYSTSKGESLNHNIYITSDEEIKEGDWYIDTSVFKENIAIDRGIYQMKYFKWGIEGQGDCKKIILTTDQDLVKNGVQAINDEFLEWFVENPSCEEITIEEKSTEDIEKELNTFGHDVGLTQNEYNEWLKSGGQLYKIIIPKEEPKQNLKKYPLTPDECYKQETLEETAISYAVVVNAKMGGNKEAYQNCSRLDFIAGAKWQAEKMYSEEEVKDLIEDCTKMKNGLNLNFPREMFTKWFEEHKKK